MDHDFRFRTGHRLDDYIIDVPLYRGALAEVYRATTKATRETVALKVPSTDMINHPLIYYHYQNEMRILDGLDHPNIVRIIGGAGTTAYSVFEYIPGIDLRHHIQGKKQLSLERACDYALQISQGLGYLHGCGIIHLDIKPENILITPLERVKIIDFGLARHLGKIDLLFEDFARPHGTPDYVSPEQLAHHRNDPRADQYSLALVLYEMLTGRLPYEKSRHLHRVRRRLKQAPVPPRKFRKEIPEVLQNIILKALSVDPRERFVSMDAFSNALKAVKLPEEGMGRSIHPATAAHGRRSAGEQCSVPLFNTGQHGILAAITDDDHADAVVDAALQAAIAESRSLTLLTVVSSDATDDWIRYSDASRGERLSAQLARWAPGFRRAGVDPTVRIRSGKAADVIISTAKTLEAECIFMGPSRYGLLKRIFGGGTLARVMKRAPCRVAVARQTEASLLSLGSASRSTDPAAGVSTTR